MNKAGILSIFMALSLLVGTVYAAPAGSGRTALAETITAGSGSIERIAVSNAGVQGNDWSMDPSVSRDGRFVAFESTASNLVPGDKSYTLDVFVRDRQSQTTELISVAMGGGPADNSSGAPSISADGRFVAFESGADDLAAPCTVMGYGDIFVRDRQAGTTECVSLSSEGEQSNWGAMDPSISGDGRFVAFRTLSNNMVPNDTNLSQDVFVRDRQLNTTKRVSVASDGTQSNDDSFSPAISANGRFVAFESRATNLVPGTSNGNFQIYVHDLQTGATERVSVSSSGIQGIYGSYNASISADGRFVSFNSQSTNLVPGYEWLVQSEIYVRDRLGGKTEIVSVTSSGARVFSGGSMLSSISGDGRLVAFESGAYTLVPGGTQYRDDCYLHDRLTGKTERISVASDGTQPNDKSRQIVLSMDGHSGVFTSRASNLVPDDTNEQFEVFAATITYPEVKMLTVPSSGANDGWTLESTEASGQGGAMNSTATYFITGDNAQDKQYRGILSFNTAGLPDNAIITSVTLKIKKAGLPVGTDPFKTHGNIVVDVRMGAFSGNAALQAGDFQAAASKNAAMTILNNLVNGWYSRSMAAVNFTFINKKGLTQFRLRFAKDDNDDLGADYLKFYSGDALTTSSRPQLIIKYYVP